MINGFELSGKLIYFDAINFARLRHLQNVDVLKLRVKHN